GSGHRPRGQAARGGSDARHETARAPRDLWLLQSLARVEESGYAHCSMHRECEEGSMSRLQAPDRAALSAEAQAIWDRIAATRSGGQMRGPSSIMMNVPELASRVMEVEDYFRTDAELPPVDRELVILATAREWGARFAWARHESRGREVNLRPEAIALLRKNE